MLSTNRLHRTSAKFISLLRSRCYCCHQAQYPTLGTSGLPDLVHLRSNKLVVEDVHFKNLSPNSLPGAQGNRSSAATASRASEESTQRIMVGEDQPQLFLWSFSFDRQGTSHRCSCGLPLAGKALATGVHLVLL